MGQDLADKFRRALGLGIVEKLTGFAGFDQLSFVHEGQLGQVCS